MKCQNLFSGKSKKKIINLLSAEFAQSVLSVKITLFFMVQLWGMNIYEMQKYMNNENLEQPVHLHILFRCFILYCLHF